MLGTGRSVRGRAILTIILGTLFALAGLLTWLFTRAQLAAQHITVPVNDYGGLMSMFSGRDVTNPLAAMAQAMVINEHAMEATGGLTFAQLEQADPVRATAQTAAFLQSSLFTSVLAWGLALLLLALGLLFIIVGSALWHLSDRFDGLGNALASGGYGGGSRLVGAPAEGVVLAPGVSYQTTDYVVPTTEYVTDTNTTTTEY